MIRKHVNPTSPKRIASAPYNFVPLPDKVVPAPGDLPNQDEYHKDRKTGYFDVTLTTRSPLYVRCGLPLEDFVSKEKGADANEPFRNRFSNRPGFFYTSNPEAPVIPGSSLRGMLRSVVEIASYSKVQWVSDKKWCYRTFDTTSVGDDVQGYRSRMQISGSAAAKPGFLRKQGSSYKIVECEMARVHHDLLGGPNNIFYQDGRTKLPKWKRQRAPVWVQLDSSGRHVGDLEFEFKEGYRQGWLVITGYMPPDKHGNPKKLRESVFFQPGDGAREISVPGDMIKAFHDDDQITQWQQKAFPKDEPTPGCREQNGFLMKDPPDPGEPVFFLEENGALSFFGRAQMFRLPYTTCPADLRPSEHSDPRITDYAEAIFGYIEPRNLEAKQGEKDYACAGRVFVTQADYKSHQANLWLSDKPFSPRILGSPKPSCVQHYLVQNSEREREILHYDSDPPPQIRGSKLYWHQGKVTRKEIEAPGNVDEHSTQHTCFKPVDEGVTFKFRVYFENLSEEELGALCWALHPLGPNGEDYCHKLGMGKPLGMGSVKLKATLHITDRGKRYRSLFDGDRWDEGNEHVLDLADRSTLEKQVERFEAHVLKELGRDDLDHLWSMKRIGMLLAMMKWPGFKPEPNGPCYLEKPEKQNGCSRPNTRYMTIQPNEYRHRPVLPDPSKFGMKLSGDAQPNLPELNAEQLPDDGGGCLADERKKPDGGDGRTRSEPRQLQKLNRNQPPPKDELKLEDATIISIDRKKGKATIQLANGATLPCSNVSDSRATCQAKCRVRVQYVGGAAKLATWKHLL